MALTPKNEAHGLQIIAGTDGRKRGHFFEKQLTEAVNGFNMLNIPKIPLSHI